MRFKKPVAVKPLVMLLVSFTYSRWAVRAGGNFAIGAAVEGAEDVLPIADVDGDGTEKDCKKEWYKRVSVALR